MDLFIRIVFFDMDTPDQKFYSPADPGDDCLSIGELVVHLDIHDIVFK